MIYYVGFFDQPVIFLGKRLSFEVSPGPLKGRMPPGAKRASGSIYENCDCLNMKELQGIFPFLIYQVSKNAKNLRTFILDRS